MPIQTGGDSMDSDVERIKDLVQHFRVCWDTWPEYSIVRHEKRQIGFALDLYGTHEAGVEHPQPGCSHCQRVYDALRQIAAWTLPKDLRPSSYELSPFDHSIGYSPAHGNRPEIILTIRILHGGGRLDNPVDPCEIRCLREIEDRLSEVSVCRGRWSVGRDAPAASHGLGPIS